MSNTALHVFFTRAKKTFCLFFLHFLVLPSLLPCFLLHFLLMMASRCKKKAWKCFKYALQTQNPPQKWIISMFWSMWQFYPHYFKLLEHNTHSHCTLLMLVLLECVKQHSSQYGVIFESQCQKHHGVILSFSCFIILFGCFSPFSSC